MLLQQSDTVVESLERLILSGWYGEAEKLNDQGLMQGALNADAHRQIQNAIDALRQNGAQQDFPGHEVFGFSEGMIVSSLQFRPLTEYRHMQAAFKQGVNWIEIETSSQCNRKCHYCPNSQIDRRSDNSFMDAQVFTRLVNNLRDIDYEGTIALVGLNEFFMHEENFQYLAHIRKSLPKCSIRLFSNGDYVTSEHLDRAAQCGVSEMFITLHGSADAAYNAEYVLDRIVRFQKKTGVQFTLEAYEKDERLNFYADIHGMRLTIGSLNFDQIGHNWAGELDFKASKTRQAPCSYPLRQFVVNYAGDIFICCVVPRDKKAHTKDLGTMVGNLADYPSLFDAYGSEAMRQWREASFSTRNLPKPCDTCTGHEGVDETRFVELADYVGAHNRAIS